ncbi:unnamed protein product [Dibothriocephalus latus]|uniref:BTB domain-containing protein n=1 Tax=Dibothriocephalus latus TaxID=60516 RepID=A0A3P6U2P5_DIBLA|nr:unnamed protein product [Dibothriocephalus latus]
MIENVNSEQVSNLLEGLQRCRLEGLYTDIILCVDEEEFPCHKVILAASSRYFDAMFRIPLSEQKTSRVYIKQISPWSLKHLIDFAYTGSLTVSTQTVQDVFLAANLLDYPLAVEACILFMERHLDITNCLGVQMLAEAYDFPALAETARKIAVDNFTRQNCAHIPFNLQVVLKACLNWVAHDPDNRLHYLVTLLHHVRLHQIPTQRLKEIIDTSSVLRAKLSSASSVDSQVNSADSNSSAAPTGTDAVQDSSPSSTDLVGAVSSLAPPRPATVKRDTLIVLGGINSYILDSVEALSFSKSCWLPCPRLPTDSLTCFSAIVVDNTLIVTGGIRLLSLGLIVLPILLFADHHHPYTIMEMGGTLDVYSLIVSDRMAIYHMNTDFSVQTPEDYIALPQPVRYATCAVDPPSRLVYIFWELTGDLSVLDFYRQSMRSLKPLSSLPQAAGARVHCGCAWVNHRLYVCGGFRHFVGADRRPTAARDDLHCYDPLTDTW